jgi:hypothetical protein
MKQLSIYRAQRAKKKKDQTTWVIGNHYSKSDPNNPEDFMSDIEYIFDGEHGIKVDGQTVGMTLGFTDKNGQLVFEDDIVRFDGEVYYFLYKDHCFYRMVNLIEMMQFSLEQAQLKNEDFSIINPDYIAKHSFPLKRKWVDNCPFEIVSNAWDLLDWLNDQEHIKTTKEGAMILRMPKVFLEECEETIDMALDDEDEN